MTLMDVNPCCRCPRSSNGITPAFLYCGGYRLRISSMSFRFCCEKRKGIDGLFSGVSRCWRRCRLHQYGDGRRGLPGSDLGPTTKSVALRFRLLSANGRYGGRADFGSCRHRGKAWPRFMVDDDDVPLGRSSIDVVERARAQISLVEMRDYRQPKHPTLRQTQTPNSSS